MRTPDRSRRSFLLSTGGVVSGACLSLHWCDGSSFVTSGRGQPTMTIQALAFRTAGHIAQFARRNEI